MPDRATAPPPRWTAWGVLGRTLRRRRGLLGGSYLLLAVWASCEALVPVVIGEVVDRGIATGAGGVFLGWLGVLALLMVVLSNGYRYGARLGFRAQQEESHALRVEVAAHALHPRGARSALLPGETLSVATGDADQVGLMLRLLSYALAALTSVVVAAVYLVRVDPVIGLVVLIGVPTVLGTVQVVSPLISRRTEAQQAEIARATGIATDVVRGLRPLKGIGGEDVAVARYRRASGVARDAGIRTARSYGYLFGLTTGLSGVFLAVVALLAGRLALSGDISLGELIAIVGLAQFLAEPIAGLAETSAYFASAHASAGRLAGVLATPRLVAAGEGDVSGGGLELAGVAAGPVLDVSLRPAAGRFTAVAVDDPAVAEALVDVLRGERDVEAGAVRLGGVDLAGLTVTARLAAMVVSPHHVDLFEGTLRDTVDPAGALTPEQLDRVLRASAADDVVALYAEGTDAAVTASGSTLSGGQRQRVGLARALAVPAPVLVLHDPTSAVDAVTEQGIARGLRELRHAQGSTLTTVVLTSSPALLDQADEVVVIRDGRVVGTGVHRDLLGTDQEYRSAMLR